MATYRDIVYMVLDEIKALGGDATITEEHVIFLANLYRVFLIQQELEKEKASGSNLSSSNYLTVCLTLELTLAIPGLDYCNETYLKSKEEIPATVDGTTSYVYPVNYFDTKVIYITRDRFKFVGYNKYMRSFIYCCMGLDNHLYFKGYNPLFLYMQEAKFSGIFEDSEKAAELSCDDDGDTKCDILDLDFPLEVKLIPAMIELIVKELYGAAYRPNDDENNAKDDIADLATYMRMNTKSGLAKLLL